MCIGVDWGGIQFKFHSNPPQPMWIDVNPTTSKQDLTCVASLLDVESWNATPGSLDIKLWPFMLQTINWDARNGAVFRNENPSSRSIVSKVCDDLVI
jgi:hypothetical protein